MTEETIIDSISEVLIKESLAISSLMDSIHYSEIQSIIRILIDCKGKIFVTGCGTSAAAAKKIVHTLCCVGCPSVFINPSDAVHGGMGVLQKEDIIIFLSKGGKTRELYEMLDQAASLTSAVIFVTENENTEFAQKSKYVLKIKVDQEADEHNILATASTIAVIAIFDAISITISKLKGFDTSEFYKIHPGGEVGYRLNQK
jgi:D-arabinose 5-phosphate isomerase GutQ